MAIVDLGSWVGSSVINLALGLERNDRVVPEARRIHAYDRFIWERWMDDCALGTDLAGRFQPGELFLEEFRRRTARWASAITVHAGDLLQERWDPADPIEFLFNDASKSWELVGSIAQTFFPALIPGRSLVVEQDFAHYYTPWVHLLRYRFRRCFEPVRHVRYSASAVFRCIAAPPRDLLDAPLALAAFTEEEIRAAFAESFRLTSPEMRANVAAAQVMLYVHAGDLERAASEVPPAARRGVSRARHAAGQAPGSARAGLRFRQGRTTTRRTSRAPAASTVR